LRKDLTLADGYRTPVYYWPPAGGAAGLPVVYLHGIQSHPGWFSGSAGHLAGAGHPVWQPTRRGSGLNTAARGDARSPAQLLDDVATACRVASQQAGGVAVHLVGVSWGGKLAACYAAGGAAGRPLDTPAGSPAASPVASLTLVCPGIAPRVDVPLSVKAGIALSLLIQPTRRFDIPLNDVSLFTDNERMRDYLRRDRHRLRRATARFMFASRLLDRMLARSPAGCLSMPVTLILADRDRIIDNDATSRAVSRLAGGPLATHVLRGCHTLEFEADPGPLYEAMART